MPLPLRYVIFHVLAKIVGFKNSSDIRKRKANGRVEVSASYSRFLNVLPKANNRFSYNVGRRTSQDEEIVKKLTSIADIMEERKKTEEQLEEWQEAAIIIDKFFFWLFIAVAVAGTLVAFLQKTSTQQ